MKIHKTLSAVMCLIIISTSLSPIEASDLNFKERINNAKTEIRNFCVKHEKILSYVALGTVGALSLSIMVMYGFHNHRSKFADFYKAYVTLMDKFFKLPTHSDGTRIQHGPEFEVWGKQRDIFLMRYDPIVTQL